MVTHRLDPISQWSSDQIGIAIVEVNTPTNADGNVVNLTITRDADNVVVVSSAPAIHDTSTGIAGLYYYVLELPTVTAVQGVYTAVWTWSVGGSPRTFTYQFQVVDPQPFWDSLDAAQKQLVDNVYHKVSDNSDSTVGGPYLWELPQSAFSFETIARLMVVDAVTLINYGSPYAFIPPFSVGATGTTRAFPTDWYGLLERATQYELFKHLATSYLEIPDPVGLDGIATLDRRRYHDLWMARADHEKEELDHMIKMLKRDMRFGVKSRSMLLAGGIFPVSYLNPARPRWPYVLSRFY